MLSGMAAAHERGLVASGVWLARGDRTVLSNASIDIPRSCVTALIAPSGAGKSTLLRCLTRFVDPDQGEITLGGTPIRDLPPRELRRRVGLVTQRPVMLEGSASDNVSYGLAGDAASPQVVAQALASAGLATSFATRDAQELSGGEQARVALARAIIRDPEILLLDEPTAALDAEVAQQLGETFRSLASGGIGLCLAIHDLPFAERFADRIVHLDGTEEPAR